MKLLSDIAIIKAGHPFRGKISESKRPDNDQPETNISENKKDQAYVIQIKDLDNDGSIKWDQLIRTSLTSKKSTNWLQKDDVIFAARGLRNAAGYIDEITNPTVCAPHYYVIKVTEQTILPEFLAWQLNQEKAQRYFKNLAEGSSQVSIRKALLEAVPIIIPTIEKQQAIIQLANKVNEERNMLQALITNRNKQMQGIAKQILS
ncbi:MAG: restriction endonuclease subunit S [Colwellia sp.]|nr:restriction endonuclease subunit S [Colwellia sp.]